MIPAKIEDQDEADWFQGRYMPGATMVVQKECLGTKFGASLFMALQELAADRVRVETL